MNVNKLTLPIPGMQPRVYFMIYFYEWRHETNELIIAGTSEQTDEVVRANRNQLRGRNLLAFNYDEFRKFTFYSEGMQVEEYRFTDPRGTVPKHAPAEWLRDPNPTFAFYNALKLDYLRRPD